VVAAQIWSRHHLLSLRADSTLGRPYSETSGSCHPSGVALPHLVVLRAPHPVDQLLGVHRLVQDPRMAVANRCARPSAEAWKMRRS